MFKTIFEATSTISTTDALISLGVAVILGVFLSLVYVFGDTKKKYSYNFAFALVRFRSVPGNSKDIVNVFFAMATGLACGMGSVLFASVFCIGVGIIYFAFSRLGYALQKTQPKQLKITIPENLNYQGAFDDLFEEYTKSVILEKVKTTNLGTLYELTYSVELKEDINEKLFIDSLRCRNGNLNIVLGIKEENPNMAF